MKTKSILIRAGIIATLCLFSFKTITSDGSPKVILISALNGNGDNEGFVITYGDGKKEVRPFNSKIKALSVDSWVQAQIQAAIILNEFKEKGYHFAGSHKILTETMILEKD